MRRSIIAKLGSRAGESIAETLIALLISALALTMLAGAISSVAKVVRTSNEKLGEYYANDKVLVKYSGTGESATVTLGDEERQVEYYLNGAFDGTHVVAYRLRDTSGE